MFLSSQWLICLSTDFPFCSITSGRIPIGDYDLFLACFTRQSFAYFPSNMDTDKIIGPTVGPKSDWTLQMLIRTRSESERVFETHSIRIMSAHGIYYTKPIDGTK